MGKNIEAEGYHLVWSDEFIGDSPHTKSWNYEISEAGSSNNELQSYIASDRYVRVEGGNLVISPDKITDADGNVSYASGAVNTKEKHEYLYGRIEIRMKLPRGKGLLPAVRLMPAEDEYGEWPEAGQIDLVGTLGQEPNKIYTTVHYGNPHVQKQGTYILKNDPFADKYHVFAMEWEPDSLTFYVDDEEYFAVTDWFSTSKNGERFKFPAPFNRKFYFRFSVAVGGFWTGDPDEATVFDERSQLKIDYVKVYQKENYEETSEKKVILRKSIAVCGAWEDAENLSMFMTALQNPRLTSKYILECFTFGISSEEERNPKSDMEFASFVGKMDHAAIIIFAEMIKNSKIINRLIAIAHKKKIPVFVLEHEIEGAINIVLDYASGFEKTVRHIIEDHGCKVVDMFAGFRGNPFSEERIAVYRKVLEENGIPFEEQRIHYGDFWDVTASQVLSGLIMSKYKLPEAIICANDSMALGVCECLRSYGVNVPKDILVSGFDGIWHGEYHSPALTTAKIDYDNFVDVIADKLDNWTEDMTGVTDKVLIRYSLVLRDSCGCNYRDYETWSAVISELAEDNQDYFRHMLEMGRFVNQTISMTNIEDATRDLRHYLWLWNWQYYFVGLKEPKGVIHAVFHGRDGEYMYDRRYRNMAYVLPDWEDVVGAGSGINVLLFKQINSHDGDIGYAVQGMETVSLRAQQRFEEFALFVSAMVISVLKNDKLIKAKNEIEKMSEIDYLTGLYNRRGFLNALDRMISAPENKGRYLTLFSMDMDSLKAINDTYGHQYGDIAITALAHGIKEAVGTNGICARYGGDEFAFAMVSDDSIMGQTDKIRALVEMQACREVMLEGCGFTVAASIGAAETLISRRTELEDMFRENDANMYKDKQARKGISPA